MNVNATSFRSRTYTDYFNYVVKEDDNLRRIAVRFGKSFSEIKSYNRFVGDINDLLFPGDTLRIPIKTRMASKSSRNHQITENVSPSKSDAESTVDDCIERQFIKFKCRRVLQIRKEICGTLLITTDMLFFEPEKPSRTPKTSTNDEAVEESREYASPGVLQSESSTACTADYADSVYEESITTYSNLRKAAGVCVHLDSVTSLNTYMTPEGVLQDRHNSNETEIDEAAFSTELDMSEDESVVLVNPKDSCDEEGVYLCLRVDALFSVSSSNAVYDALHAVSLLWSGDNSEDNTQKKGVQILLFWIPLSRLDEVYSFLIRATANTWHSEHGEISSVSGDVCKAEARAKGKDDKGEKEKEKEEHRPSFVEQALADLKNEKYVPAVVHGNSVLLTSDMLEDLAPALPSYLVGSDLHQLYQSTKDGFSLQTIYRSQQHHSGAVFLVIQDFSNNIFGAFLSEPMKISPSFYGNGETFVFMCNPKFKKFEWSRQNSYFIKGDKTSFAIGARSGHHAIWFEETLERGRSEPSDTFDNPILAPKKCRKALSDIAKPSQSSTHDDESVFLIQNIEVYKFVS